MEKETECLDMLMVHLDMLVMHHTSWGNVRSMLDVTFKVWWFIPTMKFESFLNEQ